MTRNGDRLAALLASYRNRANLTQDDLARRTGINRAYVGRIETGNIQVIYPKVFNAFRKALGFPGYELLEAMGYETDAGIPGVDPEMLSLLLRISEEDQRKLIPFLRSAAALSNEHDDSD